MAGRRRGLLSGRIARRPQPLASRKRTSNSIRNGNPRSDPPGGEFLRPLLPHSPPPMTPNLNPVPALLRETVHEPLLTMNTKSPKPPFTFSRVSRAALVICGAFALLQGVRAQNFDTGSDGSLGDVVISA